MLGPKDSRGQALRILVAIACGCAFSLFGYDQVLYGGVSTGAAFLDQFDHPTPELTGHTAAIYDIGCLLGAGSTFFISQRLGYKRTLLIGSVTVVIGAVIQTASVNIGMLMASRVVGGIGNGINTSVTPVYHSETSRAKSHGRAVIFELLVLNIGWLIAQFVTFGCNFVDSGLQWRLPTVLQVVYLLPIFYLLPFIPDSPRWLASVGRLDDSRAALSRLLDKEPSSEECRNSFEAIQSVVELEQTTEEVKLSDVWNSEGRNFFRFMLACSCQIMAQIGGVNIVAYFVVIIFEQQLGLGSQLARILAAYCGLAWIFSNLLSLLVIESWGRRKLLMIGAAGQATSFFVSGIALAVGGNSRWAGIVVVAMVYMFFFVFALAWQSIPFLYPAEIVSLEYRARFYGLANGCNWAINYVVVLITPIGIDNIGWRFYIIFGAFNTVNLVIVWFFFVETTRKSLEDVDLLFIGNGGQYRDWMSPFVQYTTPSCGPVAGDKAIDGIPESPEKTADDTKGLHLENAIK